VSKKARLLCESFAPCEIKALIEQWQKKTRIARIKS
jgi:hypothetical protein